MNEPNARNDGARPSSVTFEGGLSWTRVSLPRTLSRIGKALFLVSSLGMLAIVFPAYPAFAAANLAGAFGFFLFLASYIVSLTQTSFAGSLTASKSALVITSGTKRRVIPIAQIAGALVLERASPGLTVKTVEIELTNGDRLTPRVPDPTAPEAIARALGFGAGGRRVHASLAKPTRRLLHPLFGFAAYTAAVTVLMLSAAALPAASKAFEVAFAVYSPLTLLLYTVLQRLVGAPAVTVGDDAIAMRIHGRTHVIARRDVAFAGSTSAGALAVEQRSGARLAITGVLLDHARIAAVARLMADGAGPSAAMADSFARYDRAGRPLTAWCDHLARAMNDASYRHQATSVDEAASVLRSAEATPEQRVGAALALRIADEPRERIRIAAASAVDDRVRIALEAIADADEDAVIERAVQRLEP